MYGQNSFKSGKCIPEFIWRQEIQKVKQFFQVVLQWSTRQQQFVVELVLAKNAEKLQFKKNDSNYILKE
jgi:hypothetical protein